MDRLLAMSVFVKVVEQGSFARAAERLDMSTSAVSRHVAELETYLATRLLNRTTRRISLTESGQAYFERALHLLADIEETEAVVSSSTVNPRGTIRLTCSTSFGVPHLAPAIGAFQARYPEVHFDISASNRFVDLVEDGLDLAIRIGDIGNPNLIARRLGSMRLIACASPDYLKRRGTPTHPDDLIKHSCFTYEYSPAKNTWPFRNRDGSELKTRIAGGIHANNGEMLAALAVSGAGIALEPDFIIQPLIESGQLKEILKEFQPAPYPIYAVYPSRRHLSAKVRTFVEFLAERFASTKQLN
ncbi:MAG: LysR family transcriptional regulator [Betaproteobacteria bacterium]|nr:LysR family transcriptional regulator [Betaproteobacteria bacterium]